MLFSIASARPPVPNAAPLTDMRGSRSGRRTFRQTDRSAEWQRQPKYLTTTPYVCTMQPVGILAVSGRSLILFAMLSFLIACLPARTACLLCILRVLVSVYLTVGGYPFFSAGESGLRHTRNQCAPPLPQRTPFFLLTGGLVTNASNRRCLFTGSPRLSTWPILPLSASPKRPPATLNPW